MDPISDFLNTLKTASRTGADTFLFPSSGIIVSIARVLERKGYVSSVKKVKKGVQVEIKLAPRLAGASPLSVRRISRLSKRVYKKAKDIRPVRNGFGTAVFSTPQGVLTDKDARSARVGGELLFEIW